MIKETKKTEEITRTVRTIHCDFCGDKVTTQYSSHICECCGKDICKKCIGHEDDTGGDYYNVYCDHCWEIGKDYKVKMKHLEDEIDRLHDEWIMKCRE